MRINRKLAATAIAAVAAAGAAIVAATPATAINPCASVAQIRYDIDDVRFRDPSLGCVYLAIQYQYQPPTSGAFYTPALVKTNLAQGVWYDTSNYPQIVKTHACTGEYCDLYGLWSGWWTTSLGYTFG